MASSPVEGPPGPRSERRTVASRSLAAGEERHGRSGSLTADSARGRNGPRLFCKRGKKGEPALRAPRPWGRANEPAAPQGWFALPRRLAAGRRKNRRPPWKWE